MVDDTVIKHLVDAGGRRHPDRVNAGLQGPERRGRRRTARCLWLLTSELYAVLGHSIRAATSGSPAPTKLADGGPAELSSYGEEGAILRRN